MSDPRMTPAARELGLDFLQFYVAGRAGVLGPAPADVVVAALGLFEPVMVRKKWREACAVVDPAVAAKHYAEVCAEVGRGGSIPAGLAPRIITLTERVVAAADVSGLALFAGWRDRPDPPDPEGRAALLLNKMREHRGGLHVLCLRACGLRPVEAIVAGPDGTDRAELLGWSGPWPDPAPFTARWQRAERMTDALAAPAYSVLPPTERAELVEILDELKETARRRAAGPAASEPGLPA